MRIFGLNWQRGAGLLGLICLCLSFGQDITSQDTSSWTKLIKAGEEAYRSGNYVEAEVKFRDALKEAEAFGTQDFRIAESAKSLGQIYLTLGKYPDAEAQLKKALSINEATPARFQQTTEILNMLGSVSQSQGEFARAEEFFRKSLAVSESNLGPQDASNALHYLGRIALIQARYSEAESYSRRLIRPWSEIPIQIISAALVPPFF